MRPDDPFARSLTPSLAPTAKPPVRATILPGFQELVAQAPAGPAPSPVMFALTQLRPPPVATPAPPPAPARTQRRGPSPRLLALRDGLIIKVANPGADLLRQVGQGLITPTQAQASFDIHTKHPHLRRKEITQLRDIFATNLIGAAQRRQSRPPVARIAQPLSPDIQNPDLVPDRSRVAPAGTGPAELRSGAQNRRGPAPRELRASSDEAAAQLRVVREGKSDQLALPDATTGPHVERQGKSDQLALPDATALTRVDREAKSDRIDPPEDFLTQLARGIRDASASLDRDRGNGKSINDAIEVFGEVTDVVTREVLRDISGDEVVENRDDFNEAFARGITKFRASIHRAIDRSAARTDASEQRIADVKLIFDTLIGAVTTIIGSGRGRGPRRRSDRGGDEPDTSAGSDRRPGDDTSQSAQARPNGDRVSLSVTPGLPVVEVRTEKLRSANARRGTPEWELLNNPDRNTIYELDTGESFRTNGFGHPEELAYVPALDKRGRDRRQTEVGREGLDNDVGGHLRACFLGGSCDRYNLTSQDGNFNNSAFSQWEGMIGRNIDKVEGVKITLIRKDPSNRRPDGLVVEWLIDGDLNRRQFNNEAGG